MKRNIYILIKPASSDCNMRCKYCFYGDVASHRERCSFGVMGEETVSALVEKTLAFADGGDVTYSFQGGEPLVAGEEFFRSFSRRVESLNSLHSPIHYCLQTNGTLLTDSLCAYFKEYDYLVGVSLDGPRGLHDENRVFPDGQGSFSRVRQGIGLLRAQGVRFNILTVMTRRTLTYLPKIRLFFENSGLNDLQFIACLEPFGAEPFSTDFAMDNEDYFAVNKALFDWYLERNRGGNPLSIRHFDNMVNVLQGKPPEMCGARGYCTGQLVMEANGNCYPCDFYCDDAHLLGNIHSHTLEEMAESRVMVDFREASRRVEDQCRSCPVAYICRGGCRRERDIRNDGCLSLNIYCDGRRNFLEYVCSKLNIPL